MPAEHRYTARVEGRVSEAPTLIPRAGGAGARPDEPAPPDDLGRGREAERFLSRIRWTPEAGRPASQPW